jgi:hypothetical protein
MTCLQDIKPGELIVVDLCIWYGWHCHEAEDHFERVYHLHCPPDESQQDVWLANAACFENMAQREAENSFMVG